MCGYEGRNKPGTFGGCDWLVKGEGSVSAGARPTDEGEQR